MSLIELKGITFGYNRKKIFDDLQFSFDSGQRIGLRGANGSGKTTFFHIIMGLLQPEKGDVCIFDRRRKTEKDYREVRKRIGLLFQDADDQLFCPTVKEDIAFGPLNLGKDPGEALEVVENTLSLLGLEGFADRVTYRLSGGEKKLVSLGTLLAMEPEILLLDEPTANLDEETTERIVNILQTCSYSYIIISHDQSFLDRAATDQYFLRNGQLSCTGK